MIHGETGGRIDIADGVRVGSDGGHELQGDFAARGIVVCFPTVFHVIATNEARVFMQYTLALAAHFVRMLGTSRTDDLAILLYLPVHPSDTPAPLNVLQAIVYQTSHAHLNGKFADGVDGARYDHFHIQIRRREDADGGFVAAWECALDCQGSRDGDAVGHGADGTGLENVVYVSELTVGSRGQVAWQQIGEGEGMGAGLVVGGLGEELPGKYFGIFDLTIETVFGDGSLVCDACDEDHLEGLELDFGVGDCEEELTGKEGTG